MSYDLDELILINEVQNCTEYVVRAGKVVKDRLTYWRLNRAIDKRYTFKMTDSMFPIFGVIIVRYRGKHFMVKDGKATLTGC